MFRMAYNFCTQMTFANGLEVSIAIGEGNYCENRSLSTAPFSNPIMERQSHDCEIALFRENKQIDIHPFLPQDAPCGGDSLVVGWVSTDDAAKIIANIANWKRPA